MSFSWREITGRAGSQIIVISQYITPSLYLANNLAILIFMAVYFLQAGPGGPIKIGFCKASPERRMATIQTATHLDLQLLAFTEGRQSLERALHERFAASHIRGEWFKPSRDLRAYIKTLEQVPLQVEGEKTGRMPKRLALKFWRDPKFTNDEALATINADKNYDVEYTLRTAYRELGKRHLPAGRKPQSLSE